MLSFLSCKRTRLPVSDSWISILPIHLQFLDELMGLYGRLCQKYYSDLVIDPYWKSLVDDSSNWDSESDRDEWARTAILSNERFLFRRPFFLANLGINSVGHEDVVVGDSICIFMEFRLR